jgi:penicillin-binding protein 1A
MWRQVMRPIHEGLDWKGFRQPGEVKTYELCLDCGKLAEEMCKKDVRGDRTGKFPLYKKDAPKDKCDCHILVNICEGSGKLCNDFCALSRENTVKEVAMLIFNKDWKEEKNKPNEPMHIYDEEKKEEHTCDMHSLLTLIVPPDTENPTEGETPPEGGNEGTNAVPGPSTVPNTVPNAPSHTEGSTETQWYEGNIVTGEE